MVKRRFAIEEIDNGYLVKVTEAGNDKYVGRWAFAHWSALIAWLQDMNREGK